MSRASSLLILVGRREHDPATWPAWRDLEFRAASHRQGMSRRTSPRWKAQINRPWGCATSSRYGHAVARSCVLPARWDADEMSAGANPSEPSVSSSVASRTSGVRIERDPLGLARVDVSEGLQQQPRKHIGQHVPSCLRRRGGSEPAAFLRLAGRHGPRQQTPALIAR